ncbi:hypothetical protein [Ramlibacter alkalitolerans]|uniref:hypothetical protein n=1 Tax=Ramlibacter alkalitolerans TaxID=2039631 RepID=UPI001F408C25|nr:hypothetical protein [Ramlibacter alkalitolerans]
MQAAQDLLLAALREAPRRYRLPPLPADPAAARAAGIEAALAFAIEAARLAAEAGRPAGDGVPGLFTWALGAFLREAMAPQGGDASFQALVLQAHDAAVGEYVRLSGGAAADRRSVRSLVDAIAHPGKTRALAPGAVRDRLATLHALVSADAWTALRDALEDALPSEDADLACALAPLRGHASLQRLVRRESLQGGATVQRYLALCERRGPCAGSRAAAAHGRSAARAGDDAERATIEAFRQLAALLPARAAGAYRVLRSLRPPPGFPGDRGKAKDEWDAAIASVAAEGAELLLLAEVKAAPAAASSDFSRLHRGLQRLAQADPARDYAFTSADDEVRLHGASLRRLQPPGRELPPHVIYCCTAAAETRPPLLSAASKAVLAAEPASLRYAQQLACGASPQQAQLLPVWDALTQAPRLRATLHQDATARLVRGAMLHPQDLVASLAALAHG